MGFSDVADPSSALTAPSATVAPLPDVEFGFVLDQVAGAIKMVTGFDLRAEVTDWIAGDTEKLGTQVDAWNKMATAVDHVGTNLRAGQSEIERTWAGDAASASGAQMVRWTNWLVDLAGDLRTISDALRDMGEQAVTVAQTVVDAVQTIIAIVSAGLSSASIPFYGQVKLVKTVKEALTMAYSAYKVIKVFMEFIQTMRSGLVGIYQGLTATDLPSVSSTAPATP